jgi:hypothetical protein
MIVNYTYRIKDYTPDAHDIVMEFASRLIRARPFLLGCEITEALGWMYITLRVTDIDRWRIKAHADKTIKSMIVKTRGKGSNIELYGVAEVANRRGLLDGEGRTPRPRRPRSGESAPLAVPGS